MFGGEFRERSADEVSILDIPAAAFEEILNFAYIGHLPNLYGRKDVFQLLKTSVFLGASKMLDHCIEFIRTHTDEVKNIVDIFVFACTLKHSLLKKCLINYIVKKFKIFSQNEELLSILFEEFSILLNAYWLPLIKLQGGQIC